MSRKKSGIGFGSDLKVLPPSRLPDIIPFTADVWVECDKVIEKEGWVPIDFKWELYFTGEKQLNTTMDIAFIPYIDGRIFAVPEQHEHYFNEGAIVERTWFDVIEDIDVIGTLESQGKDARAGETFTLLWEDIEDYYENTKDRFIAELSTYDNTQRIITVINEDPPFDPSPISGYLQRGNYYTNNDFLRTDDYISARRVASTDYVAYNNASDMVEWDPDILSWTFYAQDGAYIDGEFEQRASYIVKPSFDITPYIGNPSIPPGVDVDVPLAGAFQLAARPIGGGAIVALSNDTNYIPVMDGVDPDDLSDPQMITLASGVKVWSEVLGDNKIKYTIDWSEVMDVWDVYAVKAQFKINSAIAGDTYDNSDFDDALYDGTETIAITRFGDSYGNDCFSELIINGDMSDIDPDDFEWEPHIIATIEVATSQIFSVSYNYAKSSGGSHWGSFSGGTEERIMRLDGSNPLPTLENKDDVELSGGIRALNLTSMPTLGDNAEYIFDYEAEELRSEPLYQSKKPSMMYTNHPLLTPQLITSVYLPNNFQVYAWNPSSDLTVRLWTDMYYYTNEWDLAREGTGTINNNWSEIPFETEMWSEDPGDNGLYALVIEYLESDIVTERSDWVEPTVLFEDYDTGTKVPAQIVPVVNHISDARDEIDPISDFFPDKYDSVLETPPWATASDVMFAYRDGNIIKLYGTSSEKDIHYVRSTVPHKSSVVHIGGNVVRYSSLFINPDYRFPVLIDGGLRFDEIADGSLPIEDIIGTDAANHEDSADLWSEFVRFFYPKYYGYPPTSIPNYLDPQEDGRDVYQRGIVGINGQEGLDLSTIRYVVRDNSDLVITWIGRRVTDE